MKRRVPVETLAAVEAALRGCEAEVAAAPLAATTRKTYTEHADRFVRWLGGTVEPGGRRGECGPGAALRRPRTRAANLP